MKEIVIGMFLIINAITDWKEKNVYVPFSLFFGILGVIAMIFEENMEISSFAGGVALGVTLMLFSVLSQGGLGLGDGIVVMVLGIWLGGWKSVLIFMGGLCLAAVAGVIKLCLKKAGRKSELAFIPFLTLSYMVFCIGDVL